MPDFERNALILGVTGGIACGKSEVGRILEEMGFAVCDADSVAHGLMEKGTQVFQRVVDHFGSKILASDGGISRPLLGEIVFGDAGQREMLNKMVHPAVRDVVAQWIAERRKENCSGAVLIPLLYESGMDELGWDAVLCVSSSRELVLKRLEKRGMALAEAEARIGSQMPLVEKENLADGVILNLGTLEELESATRQAVENCWMKGRT
jgi:dephospho-CoA kinase